VGAAKYNNYTGSLQYIGETRGGHIENVFSRGRKSPVEEDKYERDYAPCRQRIACREIKKREW